MTNEELAMQIQAGNDSLLPDLWEQVKGLIFHKSYKFYNANNERCIASGTTAADLIQEGFFAVLDAVKAYDPGKSYKFTAFLNYPLMNRFRVITGGRGNNRREPLNHAVSLDVPIDDDFDTTLADTLPDDNAAAPFETVIDDVANTQLRTALDECLSTLHENERDVIERRYYGNHTRQHIADDTGRKYSTVVRLEEKGIVKLRRSENKQRIYAVVERELIESISFRASGLRRFRESMKSSVELALERLEDMRAQLADDMTTLDNIRF